MKQEINWTKWGTIISLLGLLFAGYQIWHQHNQINQIQKSYTDLQGNYNLLAQSSTVMQQNINTLVTTQADIINHFNMLVKAVSQNFGGNTFNGFTCENAQTCVSTNN